ncbi:hypothetical protein Trydic_g10112 [Trypoxylus dichotomus]
MGFRNNNSKFVRQIEVQVVLSLSDKLQITDQLKDSASESSLTREYRVEYATISEVKKSSDTITKFASVLDSDDGSLHRKTIKRAISGFLIWEIHSEMNKKLEDNTNFKALQT